MIMLFYCIIMIFFVLISVAFMTLAERKILGLISLRPGPNKVSFLGVLQPISDAVKLSNKQSNFLSHYTYFFYYSSSFFFFFFSILLWSTFWINPFNLYLNYGFLLMMVFLSMNTIFSILIGWSTFGKFTVLGSLRMVCQMISYEPILYMCIFFFFFIYNCYSFSSFLFTQFFMSFFFFLSCFYVWLPSIFCEMNRTPFDFSESESELVSGFNTDLGGSSFTLLFLSEYCCIIYFSIISSFIFFSSDFFFFLFFLLFIVWIRSVLPRFRFDKLMFLSWKFFVPFFTLILISFLYC